MSTQKFILRCSFCFKYKNICLLLYTGFLRLSSPNSVFENKCLDCITQPGQREQLKMDNNR